MSIAVERVSGARLEIISRFAPTVAENLAIDEELAREAGATGRRVLRLWWGGSPTAVLGCGDKPEKALDLNACERLRVPYVKRITGGGAVLQTDGVFNYSYTAPDPGKLDIHRLFDQGAELVVGALARFGVCAAKRGISDVAVGDLKISGNAQARKWKAILLHGTLLVDMDYDLLDAVLRYPSKEPDYRKGRTHREFVTSLRDLGCRASGCAVEEAFREAAIGLPPIVAQSPHSDG